MLMTTKRKGIYEWQRHRGVNHLNLDHGHENRIDRDDPYHSMMMSMSMDTFIIGNDQFSCRRKSGKEKSEMEGRKEGERIKTDYVSK